MAKKTPNDLARAIWRSRYVATFKDHPKRREILDRLDRGDYTKTEMDMWFHEAAMYSMRAIRNTPKGK